MRNIISSFLVNLRYKKLFGKSVSILMYHSIGEGKEFHVVRLEDFKWQMGYLKDNGFKVISLAEFVDQIKTGSKIESKTVIITFDDGYEDNFLSAFPILKKFGFPASIFLTTGNIDNKKYINSREVHLPMLDWNQIKEMHDSGLIDFEPHTVSHPKLSEIPSDRAEFEIKNSKSEIEGKLNKKCRFFCYPFGDYSAEVKKIVSDNFDAAVTVKRGFIGSGSNILELERNSIDSATNKTIFKMKI